MLVASSPRASLRVQPRAVDVIAADVGGTFTDVVVEFEDGTFASLKLPSTPPDYEQAILGADRSLVGSDAPVRRLAHGTTVATNALLEGAGARTALVTTAGFRDVLELARLRRPSLFDLRFVKPEPLVPRHLRVEIDERTSAQGEVLIGPSQKEVEHVVTQLVDAEVESVAICFLNSYANPENERQVAEWLRAALGTNGVSISVSSEIQREIREFERTSTAVINAYVTPSVGRYLNRLTTGFAERHATSTVQIIQSNASLIPSDVAARFPCRLIESGPAAGVLAAALEIADLNDGNAIAFDMGGTTAKAALIESGRPFEAVQLEVGSAMNRDGASMSGAGYVIRAPSLDISEVGAGGGSIVWLDDAGAPRVGPRSAGADPGPACYDRGGVEPTVTDANLVLGFLGPDAIAGGTVAIRPDLASKALKEAIAAPLGLETTEAAWGVHLLANTGMEAAVRAVSVERGRVPSDYLLVAYGGAGPMHAATLASSFDMRAVVIPAQAGLLCARGLTLAGVRKDAVRAYPPGAGMDGRTLAELAAEMQRGLAGHPDDSSDGEWDWRLAMRYSGQPSELLVPFDPETDGRHDLIAAVRQRFVAEHQRTYGYADAQAPIEIVSVRAAVTHVAGSARGASVWSAPTDLPSAGRRRAYFGPEQGWHDTPIHLTRAGLRDDSGPLIVEEADSTVVVPPGWRATCDDRGRLHLTRVS